MTLRSRTNTDPVLPLRIIVRRPPPGVRFAMQRGPTATAELVPPVSATADALSFELDVRIGAPRGAAPLRLLGPFVHGSPDARFLYVNSGQLAGNAVSCWNRRAKIWLDGITTELVDSGLAHPGAVLEAEVEGTARDGGPMCASTPLLADGWRLVHPVGGGGTR